MQQVRRSNSYTRTAHETCNLEECIFHPEVVTNGTAAKINKYRFDSHGFFAFQKCLKLPE